MKPQLALQYLSTDQLIPYARNARTHSRAQIQQLANSIQAFGFINPVVIDEQYMIVAGHARVLAAKQLGLEEIPTVRVEHLTEAEKRAYILADNKIAENAGWNLELLQIEIEYLTQIDLDVDIELTGFSPPEIDLLLTAAEGEDAEPPPPPLPERDQTVSRPGDLLPARRPSQAPRIPSIEAACRGDGKTLAGRPGHCRGSQCGRSAGAGAAPGVRREPPMDSAERQQGRPHAGRHPLHRVGAGSAADGGTMVGAI